MVNKVKRSLLSIGAHLGCQITFNLTSQHHYPPRAAPACQPDFIFYCVKALPYMLPVVLLPFPLNQAFNPRSLAKLEEITLVNLFHFSHHTFIAKSIVATHQSRTLLRSEPFDQLPQTR